MAELIKKYTGKFQALWNQYFWLKEAREHRIKTIGLEETPEEAMRLGLQLPRGCVEEYIRKCIQMSFSKKAMTENP